MATPVTYAELVVDLLELAKKTCAEEGVDYDEFMFALGTALLYPKTN
jgi:hypothetical protein